MTTEATSRTKTPIAGRYVLDPAHSSLQISARHLMVSKVTGTFREIEGTLEVGEDPAQSVVEVIAQSASITTGTKDRDDHLRSPDFLDVEQYPTVSFKSTAVASDGENWKLTGDLTIREITKPVTFELVYEGSVVDPFGNQKAVFTADGQIDRESWGLTWNVPLEGGGVLVSKQFKINFAVQAVLQA